MTIYMKSSLSIPKCASEHYSLLVMLWWWCCGGGGGIVFVYYKLNLRLYILFQDSKLLRAITKIVEDWIKTKVVNYLTNILIIRTDSLFS